MGGFRGAWTTRYHSILQCPGSIWGFVYFLITRTRIPSTICCSCKDKISAITENQQCQGFRKVARETLARMIWRTKTKQKQANKRLVAVPQWVFFRWSHCSTQSKQLTSRISFKTFQKTIYAGNFMSLAGEREITSAHVCKKGHEGQQ